MTVSPMRKGTFLTNPPNTAETSAQAATEAAEDAEDDAAEDEDREETVLERRDRDAVPLERDLARMLKRQLADDGTIIVKFWLHISPDEQLKRFESQLSSKLH